MSFDNHLDRLIDLAFDEDFAAVGDITTNALIPASAKGSGELWAKEEMVLSGLEVFARVFKRFDPRVSISLLADDGDRTRRHQCVALLKGPLRALLGAERTALNMVQRMSGIATMTSHAVAAAQGGRMKILDTRKTSPGMRGLDKKAVRDGGGDNHRFGLFDGVLIKDNHIAAVGGSVREALWRARSNAPRLVKVEVEITSLGQLKAAIDGGADVVLLDNMSDAEIKKAVTQAKGRVEFEVSGGITLERLATLSRLGVDFASMGALTHSARAMDLSLEILARRLKK